MASLSTALRDSRVALIKTANDTGGANTGMLHIYNGAVPANVGASTGAATLLATLTNLTINTAISQSSTVSAATGVGGAANTGVPTFARLTNSANVAYMQVTAAVGSGAELNVNQNIALGGQVTLTGSIPEGNA